MTDCKCIRTSRTAPEALTDKDYTYPSFASGKVFEGKKTGILPMMGWNSWNAFGTGNTEALTKAMVEKMVELGLDKLGYRYVVLDDGCYNPKRENGHLKNSERFPSGYKAMADFVHSHGLKFGMYNDIGDRLCSGLEVGTCGFEDTDAADYVNWDIDFIKVDNCYYLWDNATFSNPENAKYVFGPKIKSVSVAATDSQGAAGIFDEKTVTDEGEINDVFGAEGLRVSADKSIYNIGTIDGTAPAASPTEKLSFELEFAVRAPKAGEYLLGIEYATAKEEGIGGWLQVAVGEPQKEERFYDDFMPETQTPDEFDYFTVKIKLRKGRNIIRIMNHRRQENTLFAYGTMFNALKAAGAESGRDVVLSICEWGKTQPQSWGYKVGTSWRILNDITFAVGSDGDPGTATWEKDYTDSITSQYNKAVIMDEFASLERGWNDPDMLVVGMNGLTPDMNKTHMAAWCMMNSPLMLGLDLRRVSKGDDIYNIIANKNLIELNQDPLGVQAKRVYCSLEKDKPDTVYITNRKRTDILAKPLADGSVALCFINLDKDNSVTNLSVDSDTIVRFLKGKMVDGGKFSKAGRYQVKDMWTGDEKIIEGNSFEVEELAPCANVTIKVSAIV